MNAGAWAGLLTGLGAALVVAGAPWRRQPSLAARVVPYLAPRRTRSRDLLRALAALVGERLGSGRVVTERLTVLTPHTAVDVSGYRAQQLLWGCGATTAALAAVWAAAGADPVAVVAAMVVGAAGGALARDELLARAVRRRRGEVVADLPAVAELLALSVAAGENVAAALERVAAGHGPLCAGLRGALGRVRTGTPLLDALTDLAGRWQVPPFSRFVDAIAVAVEAGSPLADVLRAQVADARDAEHRRLVETGGRQEVRMMVPVVFGILPTVVVFAVYPGLAQLDLAH